MRYVVVGAGAIGGLLGARMTQAGHDVTLVARGAHLEAMRAQGLRLETPEGGVVVPVQVADASSLRLGRGDVVLLAVKGQDTLGALEQVRAAGGGEAAIVCLQNGVVNERMALRRFADVYGVVVFCPATHLEPGVVAASGTPLHGVLDLGRYPEGVDERAEEVAAAFSSARFSSRALPDVMRWKWAKLLANLSNAAEAACGPGIRGGPLAQRAVAEGRAVLAAAGIVPTPPEEEAERRAAVQFGRVAGRERAGSSTWQSLARATGSSETDLLTGEVVLLGRLHGVPTPVNVVLQATVAEMVRRGEAPGTRDEVALLAQVGDAPG